MKRLLAIALMVAAIGLSSCTSDGSYDVEAIFADVGDLVPRAAVQISDVQVGTVTKIELEGYRAKVTMRINPREVLPANSLAIIRSTSLLGEKFVEIAPPLGEQPEGRLRAGARIPIERTSKKAELQDVFIRLGEILEGGSIADFTVFINSSADIVRDKEEELGQVFAELRRVTGTIAGRSDDISAAVDSLNVAFDALGSSSEAIQSAVDSSADATAILADQQEDLNRLVSALDRFAAVSARYSEATFEASDRSLKDLRLILDHVMTSTGDLERSLTALASFVDLWPRVIPGDYVQLDVTVHGSNEGPQ